MNQEIGLNRLKNTYYIKEENMNKFITIIAALMLTGSVALADAGIPMRDLVCACASGKAADTLILDVNNEEDQAGQADMPIGYMPNFGKITLLQLDGVLTPVEFKKCIELGLEGCKQVYEIQKNALREKYFSSGDKD